LFEIENHGWLHRPCSVNGRSVYGIKGTANSGEVFEEVETNGQKIERLTGRKPKYYRSGTAYYDEVALKIVEALGYQAVGFSILGDKGATYSAAQVKTALLTAGPGSIIICHMNHPEKETAEGIIAAVPELKKKGFRFVKLSEYHLR
jgi:peptidoglycan/xylan/chitin deacetylase (PgdA/CDA1 family)